MTDAARTQSRFVRPQPGDNFLAIHGSTIAGMALIVIHSRKPIAPNLTTPRRRGPTRYRARLQPRTTPLVMLQGTWETGATIMTTQPSIIEGTASEVIAKLAHLPADERVRVIIGRPSLSAIARRLQATATANGMTEQIHDDLLRSLKNDC
jgi:hypothetical protein